MKWAEVLSAGEEQRLAFARMLLNDSQYTFLDEATSVLDVPNEQLMYELLTRQRIPLLNSGHHPILLKFDRKIMRLSSNCSWQHMEPSPEFKSLTGAD